MCGDNCQGRAADDAAMVAAIELSDCRRRPGRGGPFGAVVVRDGVIIGRGFNRVTLDNDPTAHAEVVAIRDACSAVGSFDLRGCDIFASCEPCPMCLGAILWARLDRVFYGATREDAAAVGFDDAEFYRHLEGGEGSRALVMEQLREVDARAVLGEWARVSERVEY